MHDIIYDVAVTVDGYIAGPDGDISAFPREGKIVERYLERVQAYSTVIMGRGTYELGARFGMVLGANPYPHARTIVVSRRLDLPSLSDVEVLGCISAEHLTRLRAEVHGPIYLCGGASFAAHLLVLDQIQRLRLKRVPIILGQGVPLFQGAHGPLQLTLLDEEHYGDGQLYQEFSIRFDMTSK